MILPIRAAQPGENRNFSANPSRAHVSPKMGLECPLEREQDNQAPPELPGRAPTDS